MDNIGVTSLPEKVQCLLSHKMKARVIRQNMLMSKACSKQDNIARKVIKYDTFLSHQMFDKIKSQDLKLFEVQVKQICQKQKSMQSCLSNERQLGMEKILGEVKRQTKQKLINQRNRQKSAENSKEKILFAPKFDLSSQRTEPTQSAPNASLKMKTAIETKRKRQLLDNRLKLKGTVMKSSLIDLLQKFHFMSGGKPSDRELSVHLPESIEDGKRPSQKLKQQKDRLATVLENNGSIEFKPLGNLGRKMIKRRYNFSSQKRQSTEMPSISKRNSSLRMEMNKSPQFSSNSKPTMEESHVFAGNKRSLKKGSMQTEDRSIDMKEYIESKIV